MTLSKLELKNVFLYITTAFETRAMGESGHIEMGKMQELAQQLLQKTAVAAVEYSTAEGEIGIVARSGDHQGTKTISDLLKETQDPGHHLSSLDNYALIDYRRLAPLYRQENTFVRMQVLPEKLATLQKRLSFLGEKSKCLSAVITIFASGVGLLTTRVNVWDTDVSTLCKCSRRETINQLGEAAEAFLCNELDSQRKLFLKPQENCLKQINKEVFVFAVLRNVGYEEKEIAPFVEAHVEELYSLNSGLDFRGQYINTDTFHKFLQNNLSTRQDTFLTLNFRNALVVESLWKRQNFTQKRLGDNASEQALLSREEYNDLNYQIWFEILLYQRHLLTISYKTLHDFSKSPINQQSVFGILTFHEEMSTLINNLRGSMTTVYETYQEWMERGREIMGINSRYQMFNDRIERIDKSIHTKYNYEQISKQNWLSEIGVWLSKLALFFCILEFIKTVLEGMQSQNLFPELIKHQSWIYLFFFLAFVTYFLRSFRNLREKKELEKGTRR